jgi:hypothetical protein
MTVKLRLSLPEGRILIVFQNRKLRRKFGSNRKLHNEECHNLAIAYLSPYGLIYIRRMRLVRHEARMGDMTNAYRSSMGRLEGKKPRKRRRHR